MRRTLLFTVMLFTIFVNAFGQCPSVFYDGFESGNWTPTWTSLSPYTRVVDTINPAQGTYKYEQTGQSGHYTGTTTTWTAATPPTISWWVKRTSGTGANGYVVIGDANTSSNQGIVFAYFTAAGQYRIYSGSFGDYNMTAASNVWYFVELRNINFTTKTYDIWINGSQVATNFGFRSQSSVNVDRIYLYNFSGGGAAYDNINIGGVSLNVATSSTEPLCNGDANGTATAMTSGGTNPYTYSWSNGSTTMTAPNLNAGSYSVTVTDSLGCQGTATETISEPTALASVTSGIDANCFGDSSGTAMATATGGVGGYSYLWSTGATGQTTNGLFAGNYSVVISDSNGCQTTDTVSIGEPAQLVLSSIIQTPSCSGDSDGSLTMQPSGGTPGYSYLWNTGATTSNLNNLPAGSYTCFVNDSLGCSDGTIFTLTDPAPITTSAIATSLGCNGDSTGAIDLTPAGGAGGFTYAWSNGATTQDLSGLSSGDYTVVVTDSNGCSTIDTITVSQPASLTPSAAIFNDQGTGNGSIDITVNGGTPPFTYVWSTGATTEDLTGLTAGTYTVTITDGNGCSSVSTFTVSLIIGIQNGNQGPEVAVVPNPSNGLVTVKVRLNATGNFQMRLSDLSGKVIYAISEENAATEFQRQIDLSNFASGVYLLQVESEGQQSWTRIMRQ